MGLSLSTCKKVWEKQLASPHSVLQIQAAIRKLCNTIRMFDGQLTRWLFENGKPNLPEHNSRYFLKSVNQELI